MPINKIKHTKSRTLWIILIVALLVVGSLFAYFHYHKSTTTIPSTMPKHTATTSTKSSSNPSTTSSSSQTTAPSSSSAKSNAPAANNGAAPSVPTGPFVNNHTPGQNGTPTSETSVCNTTPGASCYIEFTNGSSINKLSPQTTDSNGAAFWTWNIGDAGLSSGTWKITAIATLNGQTSSASDSANLEVQ